MLIWTKDHGRKTTTQDEERCSSFYILVLHAGLVSPHVGGSFAKMKDKRMGKASADA
jgi:hypothetical protein